MAEEVHDSNEEARKAAKAKMAAALKEDAGAAPPASDTDSDTDNDSQGGDTEPSEAILSSVKVYSPFHVYFDGQANSISAVNLTGPFDVLYGHKNFMSLLTAGDVVVRSSKGEERIKIDRGVMHVRDNTIRVFLDV